MAKKFLTSIDLCGNQLIRPVLENVSPNPEEGLAKGRIAFNTTGDVPIVYDGTYWRNLQYEIPSGTYLDSASYKSLVAIEALSGTSGFLKKTDADNWELDTNTYLLSDANAVSATKLANPRAFSIIGGATASAINFNGESNVALEVTTLNASKLTETIPSTVLGKSTFYVGTTPIKLNRASASLALTGISSIGLGSGDGIKPIIKYKDDDNAIYLTREDNEVLNLHVTGKLTTSNILNDWDKYSEEKVNWFLSAELGNDLRVKLTNKSDVGHTHTLASLTERNYDNLTNTPPLGTAASKDVGSAEGNIPILGVDGKLNDIVIPKIAISETSVVDSEDDMLNLTAEIGDIAIRNDVEKSFILKGDDPKELSNWQELITPMSPVQSVNGKTGTVMLSKEDVGLSNVDNTSDMNKPVSTAQSAALDLKADITYVDSKVKTDVPTGAKFTDTVYKHPDTHSANMITETSERRFVTDAQITAWTSSEGAISNGESTQYFRGDKQWATLDTSVVPEGDNNLYYTNERVKTYGDTIYLGKTATASKATTLATSRNFSVTGSTGLTAEAVSFNGGANVALSLTGNLKVANGGTGLTDAKDGFTRKVTGTLTTSATSYQITHGLGSDVVVQVIEVASNEVVECDIIITSENMATISFNKAPNANAYRYIIIG